MIKNGVRQHALKAVGYGSHDGYAAGSHAALIY
jgi:hypothetical protein